MIDPIVAHFAVRAKGIVFGVLLLGAGAGRAAAQAAAADRTALQRLLVAEDLRGLGPDGIAPLLEGLASRDSVMRRVAVRGLGRLQRPGLVPRIAAALGDSAAGVRAEAANALAQSVVHLRRAPAADSVRRLRDDGISAVLHALAAERDSATAVAMAQALGRMPFTDSSAARSAERAIAQASPGIGALHGMYTLALARRISGNLTPASLRVLSSVARTAPDPVARRVAMLTLVIAGALDSASAMVAGSDTDDQVRRIAVGGVAQLPVPVRERLLRRAFRDSSMIVRVAAVAAAHAAGLRSACDLVIAATADSHPYVRLMAIDSAGAACNGTAADSGDRAGAHAMLARVITARRAGLIAHVWQAPAHALVTAACFEAALARRHLDRFASAPRWQERMYAARAAAVLSDRSTLERLAADMDDNVRDAAIAGLSRTVSHSADSTYLAALGARGNQVVLTAADALGGSADPRTVGAMIGALDRLTALRSENTRDPRMMLLRRIGELGAPRDTARLLPYVADFDTTIAAASAALLSRWAGRPIAPRSVSLPVTAEPLADLFQRHDTRVRVVLTRASGGGSFVVRLFTGEAPATTARVLRLARKGYYSGAVLHRVEPNFVVQGGGPGATEYIGHQRFMRDELGSRSHLRGTVGISSRGRDTGDAQWFINLADNIRLDHEYTVFGEIISGRAVAERILEGDTIARVEVIGAR